MSRGGFSLVGANLQLGARPIATERPGPRAQMDALIALSGGLPLPLLVAAATAVAALALLVGRLLYNTKLVQGKRPPIFEGLPYVGGLIKFAKASRGAIGRRDPVFPRSAPAARRDPAPANERSRRARGR